MIIKRMADRVGIKTLRTCYTCEKWAWGQCRKLVVSTPAMANCLDWKYSG